MRIAYTSDLHIDVSRENLELLPHLARRVEELQPDVFVVAGDVAETGTLVRSALEAFENCRCIKLYVAGNHDLFAEGGPPFLDSRRKFYEELPSVCQQTGFLYVGREPHFFGRWAFIGIPGWYDASLRRSALDSVISPAQYERGVWQHLRSYDHGHVLWRASKGAESAGHAADQPASLATGWAANRAILDEQLSLLEAQIGRLPADCRSVGVVHVLPFAESVVPGAFGPPFFEAYLGARILGEKLRRAPGLSAVIHGHQHRKLAYRLDDFEVVASPIGDARRYGSVMADLAKTCVGLLELAPGP